MFRSNFQHAEPDFSDSSDDPDDPFTASYRAGPTSSRAPNTTNHSGYLPARPKFDPATAPRPPASDRRGWTRATAPPPHPHNACIPEEEEEDAKEEGQQSKQHNIRTSPSSRATRPMSLRSSRNRLPVSRISNKMENETVNTNTNANPNVNVHANPNASDANPPPQTSPYQNNRLETLLAPVLPQLRRLRATQVPPHNSAVQTKSTAQVLRARLLPVGRHVVGVSQSEPAGRGEGAGGLEVELCDYIAHVYWPQHLMPASGLRVMETYRNALFQEDVEWRLELREWEEGNGEEEVVGWNS